MDREPGLAPWQARKVLRHIGEHLDRPITIRELSETVGLSANYFSRRFKGSFGVSPRHYLIRRRLERAKLLMRQSRASLSQIALDTGFSDQAHMSRLFHAVVGETPNRWRREQMSAFAA
jgi:AraC-like DNA-binding protein